jgi:hypothetical protein
VQAVTSAATKLAGEASLAAHLLVASTCVSASGVLWLMALSVNTRAYFVMIL